MVFLRFGAVELFLQLSLAALSLATITCLNENYTYQKLAGYGFVPSNARDKFGDTLGGFGSAIAIDRKNWTKTDGVYTGILWALPDRGWYVHDPSRQIQGVLLIADSALKEHTRYP